MANNPVLDGGRSAASGSNNKNKDGVSGGRMGNRGSNNKNRDRLDQRPDNYKRERGVRDGEGDQWGELGGGSEQTEVPAWLQAVEGAAFGGALPLMQEQQKLDGRSDRLRNARTMAGRSDQLYNRRLGARSDQVGNHNNPAWAGGFGTTYGWGGGGYGGGGGGWGGGGGADPAWLNYLMSLTNWNIR